MNATPTRIEPLSPLALFVEWETGEKFSVPYLEIRYQCPCAGCVDENTGARTIQKASIQADIRPKNAQLVGRYAVQFTWSDGHETGMYHFDRLMDLCKKYGKLL